MNEGMNDMINIAAPPTKETHVADLYTSVKKKKQHPQFSTSLD